MKHRLAGSERQRVARLPERQLPLETPAVVDRPAGTEPIAVPFAAHLLGTRRGEPRRAERKPDDVEQVDRGDPMVSGRGGQQALDPEAGIIG